MDNLKCCPFCGGNASMYTSNYGDGEDQYLIKCTVCGRTAKMEAFEIARKVAQHFKDSWFADLMKDAMELLVFITCIVFAYCFTAMIVVEKFGG